MAHEGAREDDVARLRGEGLQLGPAVAHVLVELVVVLGPLADHPRHLPPEPLLVREDDRCGGILEEGEHLLDLLLGAGGVRGLPVEEVRPAPVEAAQAEAEARRNALVVGALDLDVEGDGEVLGHLLVDALVGLEDRVEVRARDGVEEAVDLVLEHVLGEAREEGGHGCLGGIILGGGRGIQFFTRAKKLCLLGCYRPSEFRANPPLKGTMKRGERARRGHGHGSDGGRGGAGENLVIRADGREADAEVGLGLRKRDGVHCFRGVLKNGEGACSIFLKIYETSDFQCATRWMRWKALRL